MLKTPQASDNGEGRPLRFTEGDRFDLPDQIAAIALLPTPAVNDMGAAYTPETWDEWTATMKAKHNNGNGHGKSLNVEAQRLRLDVEGDRLLPTSTRRDTDATVRQPDRWGEYGPAIRRHELAFGRPAPEPTKLNSKGNPKLSDLFDEWLMGLPAGWITDVPGVTWNETLKACGNGVVPQQAAAGLAYLRELAEWQVAA